MRLTHMATVTALTVAISANAGEVTASYATADSLTSLTDRSLHEVVVTGTPQAVSRSLLPYTVSVVGTDRLESSTKTQILSAISGMVPGLFVSERSIYGFGVSNGGSGHIKLRGVGGDRASGVLMMVDGQPQFAGIYSHHIADFYAKDYVERVEVLRGPGSVLYGSNAMAGAINVITRSPGKQGVHTTLTSQYGSYNTWLSTATNTTHFGRFSSLVSASYNRTDGTVKNFDFKQTDIYAKAGYDISNAWKSTADYTLVHFRGNDPIYPTLSDPTSTAIYHQNVTRGEASLTATNRYASTNGAVRAYYSYGNHFIDDPRHFHSTDDRFGVIAYQNFTPWSGAAATVGFDFDTYSGRIPMSGSTAHTPGAMATMSCKTITEYSPYITLSQSLAKDIVNINGGLRMANSDRFSTQWVPQLGVSVNPGSGYTVKANLAMGYRNPSFRELYLYRMANPDLNPEKMMNYEVSVGKTWSRYLAADITAYFCKGSDMIQVVDARNVNTGSFINKGVELSARSQPLDNLWIFASYSYLHTSLSDLVGAPKNQYYFGAQLALWHRLKISADLKGVGGLYVAPEVKHQNYALVNLKLDYEACHHLSLFLTLENLTDARYIINRGYTMPGFTALGGFRLSF